MTSQSATQPRYGRSSPSLRLPYCSAPLEPHSGSQRPAVYCSVCDSYSTLPDQLCDECRAELTAELTDASDEVLPDAGDVLPYASETLLPDVLPGASETL